MNLSNPLISVILPLHNRATHAGAAVRSVFNQNYGPIELIIVDGGTTTDSRAEIERVMADAPGTVEVHLIPHENCTASQPINEGLRAARGEYVALLSADDVYASDRLTQCLAAAAGAGAGIVITNITPVDADGHLLPIDDHWRVNYERALIHDFAAHPGLSYLSVFLDIVATTGNLFFRRDLFEAIGEFGEFPNLHYLDFFLRAALIAEPFLVREKLLVHHVLPGSVINDFVRVNEEHAAVIQKHLLRLMAGGRPGNPLADVFAAHPFAFAHAPWTKALNAAFDSLLEHHDPSRHEHPAEPPPQIPSRGREFHVTLITHELSLTGAPIIVLELASLLRERGCAVTVFSLADGPLKGEFMKRGICLKTPPLLLACLAGLQTETQHWVSRGHRLPARILHRLAKNLREFADWVWQLRFWSQVRGVLVVNSVVSWPLAVKMPITWKKPVFWYIHETADLQWFAPGVHENSTLQRLVSQGRLRMLYGSEATRQHWARNNYAGEVRYWSGISKSDAALPPASRLPESPGQSGRRAILNVGSVSGRKGTRALVEAFAMGRAEGIIPEDVELCLVGCALPSVSPEARDLIRRVHQADLRGHVRVVASIQPAAVRCYYRNAAVYAHASIFECMPLALLTAMANGLPIVATDVDGCREAIIHESCGLLVQPRQPRQMAEALARLLNDPDGARALGTAARVRFVERFSVEATFEPLYQTLAGKSHTA